MSGERVPGSQDATPEGAAPEPQAWSIPEDVFIGVDLGGTNVRAAAVKGGELLGHHARPISSGASEPVVLEEVLETIERVRPAKLSGIGCGVPSVVDVAQGMVYNVENIPSWKKVPLKRILEARFGVPAFINNDANCFALGEWRFGKGRGHRNLVGLTIGTGLGAGLILDGRLYNGTNCGAGEIGTIPYKEETVEYYCSGQRLIRDYGEPGDVLCQRARGGDREALGAFEELGRCLGRAVTIVVFAYDPDVIVFGGAVSEALPFFLESLRQELARCPQPHVVERLVIERSERPDIALLGAAALCFET